jgi:parvulin-like peptidyl-prolyl isomerase
MSGKDARISVRVVGRWQAWVGGIVAAIAVAAGYLAYHGAYGPDEASAQAPVVRPGAAGVQARPAQGPTTARPASSGAAKSQAAKGGAPAPIVSASGAKPLGSASATKPDSSKLQVMAVVNGEQITRTELGRECIRRYGKEVLESLVNRHLILAACAEKKITITNADVDAEIERVASRFGLPRDRWMQLLEEERGFSEAQYKNEVIWPMLALRQLAASDIEVTADEIKKAFESEFGRKVRARLIAVSKKDQADKLRAQAAANPNSFGELSKNHSEDPGVAAAYGVIPPIRMHLGDANLERIAFGLKPGEISPVVQVANMYYIIKCEEQLEGQIVSSQQLAQQQARLRDKIKETKLRVAATQFFDEVKKSAKIEIVLGDEKKQQAQPGVAATVAGKPVTLVQLADECIARYGAEVLDGEINRKILQQELNKKQLAVGGEDIEAEVVRAAESYGYTTPDGQPDKKAWLEAVVEQDGATVDLYVRDAVWPSVALKKLVGSAVQVTEEDLQKGFESNYGERVEAQAIVLSDHRQAQKVWDLARNNNTEAFFAELAGQYSVEPSSRSNGGKVPPIPRHGGSKQVEDEAFKLQAGELSGIVAIENQFIILRCLGRTKPVQVNFDDVRPGLTKDIHEKKLRVQMTRKFDELREGAQVDNFLVGISQSGKRPTSLTGEAPAAAGLGPQARPRAGGAAASPASATLPRPAPKTR